MCRPFSQLFALTIKFALHSGVRSERAILWVDNPDGPCAYCGRRDGIQWLGRSLGVKEVVVHTPTETFTTTIDASINAASDTLRPPAALLLELLNNQ